MEDASQIPLFVMVNMTVLMRQMNKTAHIGVVLKDTSNVPAKMNV